MAIHKLMDDRCNWIQGEEKIAKLACDYYEEIFTGKNEKIKEDILQCINPMITQEQNDGLDRLPDMDELRRIIMSMNPHSAPGPDGFGGKFYQVCFDIIKKDLLDAVNHFYIGNSMPRYMTHACLILLPKLIILADLRISDLLALVILLIRSYPKSLVLDWLPYYLVLFLKINQVLLKGGV